MAYADVQMFMNKLKQLIYCSDNPIINHPSVLCERPQFLLLCEELGSMIQILFIHEDHDPEDFEKVRNQWKKLKAVAEEAEDIVDLFLSTVHFTNNGHFPRSDVFQPSLHLEVVMRSIKSIKMEFMTISIDNMKMDSSQRTDSTLQVQSAVGTSSSRNSLGSKKVSEEIVVGLDQDIEIIRDKLVEDGKHLDVVSIVGMGGIGKTTLATKVYSDPFVVYHFYMRAWVTVSQTYEEQDMLIQILSSMGVGVKLDLENRKESRLCELLHKSLKGKRYLIVIDDIWSIEAWVKLRLVFPDDNNGSRILVTSRLTEVASHVKSDGFIHPLQYLTEEESWELLCRKVFQGDECPEWLIEPGMQIAKGCHGLPLSVVVIAGFLAKEARSKNLWEKVATSVRSYITGDQRGCLETLAMSYHHLPLHLRECFLYLGGFQEDSLVTVQRLIWLWMGEGFVQEDGNRNLEEIAEGYLMDLVDRNLVIVAERKFNGDVKVCKLHDLVRELCLEKAKEERFVLRIEGPVPFDLQEGCPNKKLLLSYHRLSFPLRECFLYLGQYPENPWRHIRWLYAGLVIEDGSQSLAEIAEGYLTDLINRNLLVVEERRDVVDRKFQTEAEREYNGNVTFCKVNDLAWNLCVEKAKKVSLRFNSDPAHEEIPPEVITSYKPRRVFANKEVYIVSPANPPTPSIRSLSFFHTKTTLLYNISEYFRSFALLRVLNLPNCTLIDFPPGIALLVHLRYLSIQHSFFPSPICNLWSLQTLIVRTTYSSMVIPSNISNLVNLKHLWSNTELYLPSVRKPTNLQTISNVMLGEGVGKFQKCFPTIKKLACTLYTDVEKDFELLLNLETLKLTGLGTHRRESFQPEFVRGGPDYGKNRIRFPATLKKLTLVKCRLPWSNMSIIQSLPNLQALRLIDNAFEGTLWETGEEQFQQLKFLRLEELNIKHWEASSINFPCLRRLLVVKCHDLQEIPLEIGDISTLEFLEADGCGASVNLSLGKIQQEQQDMGNYELKIKVRGGQISSFV